MNSSQRRKAMRQRIALIDELLETFEETLYAIAAKRTTIADQLAQIKDCRQNLKNLKKS